MQDPCLTNLNLFFLFSSNSTGKNVVAEEDDDDRKKERCFDVIFSPG